MNKPFKNQKFEPKGKKKNFGFYDEESLSLKEVKREKQHKQYRNYENALRSKNLDKLLSYEDDQ